MAEAAKNPEIWKAACMLDHFDKIQKLKVCKDETTNTQDLIIILLYAILIPFIIKPHALFRTKLMEYQISVVFLATRFTAVDSPPSMVSPQPLKR